jgi:uncharacterized membrane protein YiaA
VSKAQQSGIGISLIRVFGADIAEGETMILTVSFFGSLESAMRRRTLTRDVA